MCAHHVLQYVNAYHRAYVLLNACTIGAVPPASRGVETSTSLATTTSTLQSVFDSRSQSYDHKIPEIFKSHFKELFESEIKPDFGQLLFPDHADLEVVREKCQNEADRFSPFSGENKRAIVHVEDEDEGDTFVSRGDRMNEFQRKALFFVPPLDKRIPPDEFAQVMRTMRRERGLIFFFFALYIYIYIYTHTQHKHTYPLHVS
jgi:hypothetical protein